MLGVFIITSPLSYANTAPAPSFERDFAKKLIEATPDNKGRVEKVFDISCVSQDNTLKKNVECLFFPGSSISGTNGGILWNIIRYAGMLLIFVYLVFAAIDLLMKASKGESIKQTINQLLYILIGAAIFLWSMWLFGNILNISSINTTAGLRDNLVSKNWILFFLLSFLKGLAFFVAVIMIVVTGFQLMNPQTWEKWDGKKLIKNLVNIIFALVGMKVIDFIYLIASQSNFAEQAGAFIIQIAKFLAYISGSIIVIMIIYAWYLLIIDWGKGENFKKAKNTIINIVLGVGALFFFLFIMYQIFAEFN